MTLAQAYAILANPFPPHADREAAFGFLKLRRTETARALEHARSKPDHDPRLIAAGEQLLARLVLMTQSLPS